MKSLLFSGVCLVLAACGQSTKPVSGPEPIDAVPVPVREVYPLQGYWKHFGVSGSDFNKKPGTAVGGEGSLIGFKTLDGQVWYIEYAPNDDFSLPLSSRSIYMVHISSDASKGCGIKMPDFNTAPEHCILEERITTWDKVKTFLKADVGFTAFDESNQSWTSIEGLETFLAFD